MSQREQEFRQATHGYPSASPTDVGETAPIGEASAELLRRRVERLEAIIERMPRRILTPRDAEAAMAPTPNFMTPISARANFGGLSALEYYAGLVANDVEPQPEQAPGQEGAERAGAQRGAFVEILTAVMAIFSTLMSNCPLPKTEAAAAIRNPNNRQQAALYREIMRHTGPLRIRKQGAILRSMLARGQSMTEVDALAVVDDGSNDQNLLF